jgi:hypothetical protein
MILTTDQFKKYNGGNYVDEILEYEIIEKELKD